MRLIVALAVGVVLVILGARPLQYGAQVVVHAQTPGPSGASGQRLKYVGVGSCAAGNCHGSVTPSSLPGIEIKQNEHYLWLKKTSTQRPTTSC